MFPLLFALALAAETRETFDPNGHLAHRQVVDGVTITEETSFTYDLKGNLVAQHTTRGAAVEDHTWTYDGDGHELTHEVLADGDLRSRTTTTWATPDGGASSSANPAPSATATGPTQLDLKENAA